jgi:uncharacterized protein DUF1937
MIYLASPYKSSDPRVMVERYDAALKYTASLIQQGHRVFCTVVYTHPLNQLVGQLGWGFWKPFDFWFLARCDKVIVLKLPGWQESVGVEQEIEAARMLGLPVEFAEP